VPVTAKLSKLFYERLGEQIADELVGWFNAVDATYRSDLRELNELNFARFDAKLEQRFAQFELKMEQRFAQFELKMEQRIAAFEAGMEHHKQYEPLMTFCNYINNLQFRAERESCESIMQDLLQAIAYEAYLFDAEEARAAQSKWSNVLDFVGWLNKKAEADGKTVIELTQLIALLNILEGRDEGEVDVVRLSTLHASKGLEFGHVFLVGIEEGILPHRESVENGQIEEERRLMYVGITRAQKSLTLTHCKKRKRAGEWQGCEPSRFIDELAQEDLRVSGRESDPATQKAEGTAKLDQLKAMLSRNKAGAEN